MTDQHAALYAEVQQFYARQMRMLDDRKLEDYAGTFTEDAEFGHTPGREPARTRPGIVRDLVEFHRRFEDDPQQRRHFFTMIDIEPRGDGTVASVCYALITTTRPGRSPEVVRTCVVHDVLERDGGGGLLNRSRHVEHD